MTYEYNAMGERVARDTAGVPQALFLHDGVGNQIAELNAARQPQHVNVYAGSHLIGTLQSDGVHYAYSDWLGTKRYETGPQGGAVNSWASLPFGDSLTPQVTGGLDATEQHFTGKEHDAESGLDYFGARYYQAQTGRWLLPDWSATPVPVPYAVFSNPQSLNLYTYVGNNPINAVDSDGHTQEPNGTMTSAGTPGQELHDLLCSQHDPSEFGCLEHGGEWTNDGAVQTEAQQTNAQIRQQIAENANSLVGNTSYNYKDRGKDTCNLFVADQIADSGAARPQTPTADGHMHDPSASEWGTPDSGGRQNIPGWSSLRPGESPQPGDVAAVRTNAFEPGSPAHSGIVTAVENGKVTVVASNTHRVGPNPALSGQYPQIVYRRYTGGN